MTCTKAERAFNSCTIEILIDEDWNDIVTLRQLNADGEEVDLPFDDIARLDLYIRPTFNHTALVRHLSSADGHELRFDPDVPGTLQIYVPQPSVRSTILTGRWDQFLVATYNAGARVEFWRGPLIVHPGRT